VFGGALVGRFLRAFYRGRGKKPLSAGSLVARAVAGALLDDAFARDLFTPVPALVQLGARLPRRAYMLLVASTLDRHFGVRVTYRAREDPRRFHFVASSAPCPRLARRLRAAMASTRWRTRSTSSSPSRPAT
jgi:hypothetical protein